MVRYHIQQPFIMNKKKFSTMKKVIIYFIVLLILTFNSYSQAASSALKIRIWDNSMFTVEIADKKINNPSRFITINNLKPETYEIRIVKHVMGEYGFQEVLYAGRITIPANAEIVASINRHNMLNIIDIKFKSNDITEENDKQQQLLTKSGYYQLIDAIISSPFDSRRLEIIESIINQQNKITAIQAYQIMTIFQFEATKLDFAKFVYTFIVNKEDFSQVYSAFSYDKSVTTLSEYIQSLGVN